MKRIATLIGCALILAGAFYRLHADAITHAYGCGQMAAALEDGQDDRYPHWYASVEKRYHAENCESFERK